ncbi:MAG: radical SAM protein, partial [Verrucomicrobiota bacterium]|nr:radical SAM protein [Verrucomicrobiota bacterium]
MKSSLHGLFPDELRRVCVAVGESAFRGDQLWQWLQVRHALTWEEMRNLPRTLKEVLSKDYTPSTLHVVHSSGEPGGTRKWLLELADGETMETVRIPARDRSTVCVSSQVGCRRGCAFCASGQCGFARNLSAGEIVAQVQQVAALTGGRPDNVVFMGMGEPFDNYEAVLKAVRLLNHPEGLGIGARKITLSTSGVVPGIRRLAEEG